MYNRVNIAVLLVLLLFSACATQEPQPAEISDPEVVAETPVPLYINSRYRELMNNSMYEISQSRQLRFSVRLHNPNTITDAQASGFFVYIQGDDMPARTAAEVLGISMQELTQAFEPRVGRFTTFEVNGHRFVAVLGRNIDAALLAVERNEELQELILAHLGQHFYPR